MTARRMEERLKEEIKKQNDFFHTILDALAEGVLVIDRDMRIITANKGYLKEQGLKPEEAVGRHCYAVSHGYDKPCVEEEECKGCECPVLEVFETGEPASTVHIHKDKSGNKHYVSISAHPIKDPQERVVQVVETINDITEKKKADDELKKKIKELEEFYDMAVGRELKMVELKEEIERLGGELKAYKG